MMHAGTKSVEVKYERDGKDYTVVLEPKQNEEMLFLCLELQVVRWFVRVCLEQFDTEHIR